MRDGLRRNSLHDFATVEVLGEIKDEEEEPEEEKTQPAKTFESK